MPALSWSTKTYDGFKLQNSDVKSVICRIRCSWRRMAHRMAKRLERKGTKGREREDGMSVLPRTRTSRVPELERVSF